VLTAAFRLFTKIAQVAKTIDSRFVTVAPAEVQRVTANQAQVLDFEFVGNTGAVQDTLTSPLIHALRTGTRTPQLSGSKPALPAVSPGDAEREVILVFDFARLDSRSWSFSCHLHQLFDSIAFDTDAAFTSKWDAFHTAFPSRIRITCGDSCLTPVSFSISREISGAA